MIPPSGRQVPLAYEDQTAVVVEVGGGIRTYDVGGVPVLDGYAKDEMVTGARGLPLIPWPNRLHGGSYTWDGQRHEVPIDEPAKGSALHGLTRFRNWTVTDHTAAAVTMTLRLHPSPPYPFCLDLAVRYRLGPDGLTVQTSATNVGVAAAPYAQGAHPYVTVGGVLDDAELTVPAGTWLPTDEAQIPTGRAPVEGTAYDFRTARRIGDTRIDHALTDLVRDSDGRAWVELSAGERSVGVWLDEGYPYVEVFTGDTLPDEKRRRRALGVEPMTAPPDAFVTGEGVLRLAPGDAVGRSWGIRAG